MTIQDNNLFGKYKHFLSRMLKYPASNYPDKLDSSGHFSEENLKLMQWCSTSLFIRKAITSATILDLTKLTKLLNLFNKLYSNCKQRCRVIDSLICVCKDTNHLQLPWKKTVDSINKVCFQFQKMYIINYMYIIY